MFRQDYVTPTVFKFEFWSPIDKKLLSKFSNSNSQKIIHVNPPQPIPGSLYTIPRILNFDSTHVVGGLNQLSVSEKCSKKPIAITAQDVSVCYNHDYDVWENFNLLLYHLYKGNTRIDECLYTRLADCIKLYIELVLPLQITFDPSIRINHVGLFMKNVQPDLTTILGVPL